MKAINVLMCEHDIPREYEDVVCKASIVAWDIETSGLDWRVEKIATCQLYVPDGPPVIIRINDTIPRRLGYLLENSRVRKVFHHAMFDLSFMIYYWKVEPKSVSCTKVASKILDKENSLRHNLKPLLEHYLGMTITKNEAKSNWLSEALTDEQVEYAIEDVLYLPALMHRLENELKTHNLLDLAHACFDFIPTRAKLDIQGYNGIYDY